ncbi:MAG: type II toxin-antitoxin system RelE/ParE family toxin [Isosphaeraceae bacterium]
MTYRLRVTARAVADADEAYAWIAEHLSPAQAERWYQGLFKQMETLTRQPSRCPRATESDKFPEELRELLYGKRNSKYRIVFAIRNESCSTSITLPARNWSRSDSPPHGCPPGGGKRGRGEGKAVVTE